MQRAWQDALGPHGLDAAQILLTSAEIAERRAYVNVRNALAALFALGSVPVVNENDATATDEISFGDNDALAAQVAVLVNARLLVLLTSVPGVLREGVLVEDGASARSVDFGPGTAVGRGGMESKIAAAELAAGAGIPTVIADGAATGISPKRSPAARAERASPRRSRRRRSSSGCGTASGSPGGSTSTRAPVRPSSTRASLLAVGVTAAEGGFRAGDGVELVGPDGDVFARGIASVDAADLGKRPANVEAVHRDRPAHEVHPALVDEGGENLLRGARRFSRDFPGLPATVDTSKFAVGENLALTPGAVVLRTEVFELIQYAPQTARGARGAAAVRRRRRSTSSTCSTSRPAAAWSSASSTGPAGVRDLVAQPGRRAGPLRPRHVRRRVLEARDAAGRSRG